jgi:hypothetical protein
LLSKWRYDDDRSRRQRNFFSESVADFLQGFQNGRFISELPSNLCGSLTVHLSVLVDKIGCRLDEFRRNLLHDNFFVASRLNHDIIIVERFFKCFSMNKQIGLFSSFLPRVGCKRLEEISLHILKLETAVAPLDCSLVHLRAPRPSLVLEALLPPAAVSRNP